MWVQRQKPGVHWQSTRPLSDAAPQRNPSYSSWITVVLVLNDSEQHTFFCMFLFQFKLSAAPHQNRRKFVFPTYHGRDKSTDLLGDTPSDWQMSFFSSVKFFPRIKVGGELLSRIWRKARGWEKLKKMTCKQSWIFYLRVRWRQQLGPWGGRERALRGPQQNDCTKLGTAKSLR